MSDFTWETSGFIGTVITIITLILKYREVIAFLLRGIKFLWMPFKCLVELIKMPFILNEQAKESQQKIGVIEATLLDLNKLIKKELNFNGGSSIKDSLMRIEERIFIQEHLQSAVLQDADCGYFYCSLDGQNKWVNRTFARYLGCGTSEILGFGWKRFIKTDELHRYNGVWQAAFKDGCEFEDIVEFVDVDHNLVRLKIVTCPIIDDKGQVLSYVGTVVVL